MGRKPNNFQYFQPNMKDIKDEVGDCVVRALCKAVNKNWSYVFDELVSIARENQYMPNDKPCYIEFLKRHGFKYQGISNKKGTKRPTAREFARESTDFCVMVLANHLSTCGMGKFYDTWDCGDKCLYGYWKDEKKCGGLE